MLPPIAISQAIAVAAQAIEAASASADWIKTGITGSAAVILSMVIVVLWRDSRAREREYQTTIQALQAQRVADAQAVTTQLLETNQVTVTALTNVANTGDSQRDAMMELKGAFEKLADEIRRRGGR